MKLQNRWSEHTIVGRPTSANLALTAGGEGVPDQELRPHSRPPQCQAIRRGSASAATMDGRRGPVFLCLLSAQFLFRNFNRFSIS